MQHHHHQQQETDSTALDYYDILEIPKSATEKQIGSSYKRLALKYHPDRNIDNPEAAAMFKAVGDAYSVLIDANKRRQYDLGGISAVTINGNFNQSNNNNSSNDGTGNSDVVDMSKIGGLGRVFGAVISRLGVPVPTYLSHEIIETAQSICRSGGLDGSIVPLDPRVQEASWNVPYEGKVERQAASFHRLIVTDKQVQEGVIISVKSANKDKFKLVLFEHDGSIAAQVTCHRYSSNLFCCFYCFKSLNLSFVNDVGEY